MCLLGLMKFDLLKWPTIINFNIPDIWQTLPDSQTITMKQNVQFQVRIFPELFQLDQIHNMGCCGDIASVQKAPFIPIFLILVMQVRN